MFVQRPLFNKLLKMNLDLLIQQFHASLGYIKNSVAAVPDPRAAEQKSGVVNHPAWTLTHLVSANNLLLQLLGESIVGSAEFDRIAGPGSMPVSDRSVYPPLPSLIQMLDEQHQTIDRSIRSKPSAFFDQASPEMLRGFAPTIGHIATFLLATHEYYHLAQIEIWRRVVGLKS